MRRLSIALLACAALAACSPGGGDRPLVEDARVRLSAVSDAPSAGYFTLKGGKSDDRLLRIDSAVVEKIEMHESAMDGGMMTMRPLKELAVPAGATVTFAPAGSHAMLFGIDNRITPGTGIPMLFTFASGAKIQVEAKTMAPGTHDMGSMEH
ncbi:copper chaperone PCu(A)C [Rhizorhabdus phycosphaerae]|uniref:copper chaperone PCu(A)C n=1 Tax=Rhizorhabdus phycosphaerae TaxID=2711156 RepID=UPI0013EE1CDA|nr:copper chaperone PCu(A)C [Rhizorhabdus phycosphaerae]